MKFVCDRVSVVFDESLPARGVWIEMQNRSCESASGSSLPARGVWIEIFAESVAGQVDAVTPRKGSVD